MELPEILGNNYFIWPVLAVQAVFGVFSVFCLWRLYAKAGEPGWAVLIPGWNLFVFYRFVWGRGWWCLLLLIPLVNVFVWLRTAFLTAECFGKGLGFGFGLLFLPGIFIPILALCSAQYRPCC